MFRVNYIQLMLNSLVCNFLACSSILSDRMMGLVELEMMLCIAGDSNAHVGVVEPGEEEIVGRYGWGARNRKG